MSTAASGGAGSPSDPSTGLGSRSVGVLGRGGQGERSRTYGEYLHDRSAIVEGLAGDPLERVDATEAQLDLLATGWSIARVKRW